MTRRLVSAKSPANVDGGADRRAEPGPPPLLNCTDGLRALQKTHPCIGDIRGRGLLLGLEFADHGGKEASAISDAVTDVALEVGLSANIVRAGSSGGTMRIAPPLTVTDAEIDLGVELLGEAIARVMPG